MPIIGTAGHVDHGKSTLVQALTGRDPDRWAEEKERGLTIDLGFAWTDLGPDLSVGFVDVPGHERFMKNMLAGVGALDVALFVVAADEGWMPQSEEHLSVLDLLEVRHGVVAVSRSDLVDDDMVELVQLEVADQVNGTVMAEWPIVPVSAVTGDGMQDLRSALVGALEAAGPPTPSNSPRLWVDRAFVISGAGVVVTGTLAGAPVARGDQLALYPGGEEVRVRGLQSHEAEVEVAEPGTRTAINLAGLDRGDIERGALVAGPGTVQETRRALATVTTVRTLDEPLTAKGAFHIHIGSGAWPARIRPVGATSIEKEGWAIIDVAADLPLTMGDRFILREVGRRAVIAGGRIIDPRPQGRLAHLAATAPGLTAALDASPDDRAQALLEARGSALLDDIKRQSGGGRPSAAVEAAGEVMAVDRVDEFAAAAVEAVERFQSSNPLRAGHPKASLATGLGLSPRLLETIIELTEHLVDDGATVRTADFTAELSEQDEEAWSRARSLLSASLAAPRASDLGLDEEVLHALLRSEQLVRIAADLVYLPDQVDEVVTGLTGIEDGFTVADFRDHFGLTRRQAVPLLEWLDSEGHTKREGDGRVVRKRPG